MNEMMLLRNMFSSFTGGGGFVWVQVALLLSLFGVLLFIPNRIHRAGLFRWACTLFALSIIIPPFAETAVGMWAQLSSGPGRFGGSESAWLLFIPQTIGPLLLGISIMLAFTSVNVDPIARRQTAARVAEQPHPLDD